MARNSEFFSHHISQQNRRNKLRFISEDPLNLPITPQANPNYSTHHQSPVNFTKFSSTSQSQSQSINPNLLHLHRQNLSHYCRNPANNSCQGLSLSLSMQQQEHHHHNQDYSAGSFPVVDCAKQMMILRTSTSCSSSNCHHPLGPFTGYATVLKQSRFLKPAQQILDDFCGFDHVGASFVSPFDESFNDSEDPMCLRDRVDVDQRKWKDFNLLSMLDEVYRRYKLCCQQIQFVVSSFEGVSGLRNASPYTALATRTVTKHFTCLKDMILDRLNLTASASSRRKSLVKRYDPLINPSNYQTGHNHDYNHKFLQFPVWRSQRGLPDHAVALLRAWLFENFLHPYPTDSEKHMLALQTGLSRTQVSNWFINARVRLWKPMVEEIHTLKERRNQANNQKQLENTKRRRSAHHQTASYTHELNVNSNSGAVRASALAHQQEFDMASGASRPSFVSDVSLPFEG